MGRVTARRPVVRLAADQRAVRADTLVVEEPLELRVAGRSLTVTMRTPGHDFDLAAGFLTTESVVHRAGEIAAMRYCAGVDESGANTYNVLDITLSEGVSPPDTSVERNFYTTSSCGLCGKAGIDALHALAPYDVAGDPLRLSPEVLANLPDAARGAQRVFARTGGLHAAGLFTPDGELACLREDVGRHNAVDKVVGWALREHLLPLGGHVLLVSGRASFELTQKALLAGIPALAAVSAPSSLAVDLAAEHGMTLVGFLRDARMNVYAGAERVLDSEPADHPVGR